MNDFRSDFSFEGHAGARLRVALLEDSVEEADTVKDLLRRNSHDVVHLANGDAFYDLLQRDSFDLLMLDWNVPGLSGYEVLRRVRGDMASSVPVLMLTARAGEFEIVQALNGGADDYLVKPCRPFELLARINVLVRRLAIPTLAHNIEQIEGLHFDAAQRVVSRDGVPVKLTHKEFEVARLMFKHLGRPLSREHLNQAIWNGDAIARTIDTHVSRVRTQLGLTVDNGFQLQAVYGFGYRLERLSVQG
ncbi:MAG: two component transcriptional regulator, receiver domain protein [Variovorax sp.]|nr:two component transcriptional regulator, receiver domain protein [Variovorax sp.]